ARRLPIVFLLLFVYVFGGTLGAGLGGASGGRAEYANYVAPAILLMTVACAAQGTAISVSMDMTEGIIDRFRTMAISRAAVLTGHVVGSMIQTLAGAAVVTGVALLVGFRPTAGLRWFAEYQPFTPIIETLRGLLLGTPIGNTAIIAIAWCVAIALLAYLWAKRLFNRHPAR
ncbi:MAG: ABC transporter permease, partial [Pseudonocardiaceae bacterium]